jgi:hypothetical protein
MIKRYSVAFSKTQLAGGHRYQRFLTPGYVQVNGWRRMCSLANDEAIARPTEPTLNCVLNRLSTLGARSMICCIHTGIVAAFIGLTPGVDEPNLAAADASDLSVRTIPVMTRNVYFGANLDPVASAPNLLAAFDAAGAVFAQVEATNMPERAAAVAGEIANQRPTLVGLQEVGTWFSGPVLNPAPATTVKYDYLSTLLSELAARGLNYHVVASLTVFDVELPTRVGGVFVQDIRLIQQDVILARGDLPVSELRLSNIQTGHYAAHLTLPVGGAGGPVVSFDRGWASVDATVRGRTVRFINTHLINLAPAIQVA